MLELSAKLHEHRILQMRQIAAKQRKSAESAVLRMARVNCYIFCLGSDSYDKNEVDKEEIHTYTIIVSLIAV